MAADEEEGARLDAEREEDERSAAESERRRLALGYAAAGAVTLAVLVGLVLALRGGDGGAGAPAGEIPSEASIVTLSGSVNGLEPDGRTGTPPPDLGEADLQKAADAAGCELRLDLEDEGNRHIPQGRQPPDYGTEPPTSGNHIVPPLQQADGAYREYPEPVNSVHSLEHGRVTIQYSPDLPEEEQLALKGVFDKSPAGVLLFPNPEMPYEVAASAWTRLLGCESYEGGATLDALRDFRDAYRGNGPEPVPIQLSG